MRFEKFGKINPSKEYSITPLKLLEETLFKRLNFLLDSIEFEKPESIYPFVDQLKTIFSSLVKTQIQSDDKIKEITKKFIQLINYSGVAEVYVNYLLELVENYTSNNELTAEIKIPSKVYWQLVFGMRYYELVALSKVIPREEATSLYKEYLDQYYIYIKETFKKFDTIENFHANLVEDMKRSTDGEFLSTVSTVRDGKFIVRNENCPAVEALDDYEDKEFVYIVSCYADYQYMKMTNENFQMTRYYTIAEGDPYCDKVCHDIRISKDLEHPTTDIIDSMGPLAKEHWRRDYFRKK